MSAANNSAKKRRASNTLEAGPRLGGNPPQRVINQPPTPQFSSMPPPTANQAAATAAVNPAQQGLTLQQVISLVDRRLTLLEKAVSDMNANGGAATFAAASKTSELSPEYKTKIDNIETALQQTQLGVNQLHGHFENTNDEVGTLQDNFQKVSEDIAFVKDTILHLQKYTMEVNKVLLEERDVGRSRNQLEEENATPLGQLIDDSSSMNCGFGSSSSTLYHIETPFSQSVEDEVDEDMEEAPTVGKTVTFA